MTGHEKVDLLVKVTA